MIATMFFVGFYIFSFLFLFVKLFNIFSSLSNTFIDLEEDVVEKNEQLENFRLPTIRNFTYLQHQEMFQSPIFMTAMTREQYLAIKKRKKQLLSTIGTSKDSKMKQHAFTFTTFVFMFFHVFVINNIRNIVYPNYGNFGFLFFLSTFFYVCLSSVLCAILSHSFFEKLFKKRTVDYADIDLEIITVNIIAKNKKSIKCNWHKQGF